MIRHARSKRATGFSLVEVMISMAILAILLVSIFQVLLSSQEVTLSTGNVVNLDLQAREAIRLLRRDLRQSGTESGTISTDLDGTGGDWVGNQIFLPKPTDAGVATFGTSATSVLSASGGDALLAVFRQRTGFNDIAAGTMERNNWTNDGTGPPAAANYIGWRVVNDGTFKNVPGVITRYKLTRVIGANKTPATSRGAAIHNLADASFRRVSWDEVEVTLTLMAPAMVWTGSSPPQPNQVKIIELIKVNNKSVN